MNLFNRKPKAPTPSNKYSEFDTVAIKLIESLRPMFVAHPDVDEIRLNVMLDLIHHGEPDIALDTLVENLQDMNWEEVSSPISEEQSRQLKYLLHGVYGYKPEQEQKYLAIVNRITMPGSPDK
jgi:hypothetical protein